MKKYIVVDLFDGSVKSTDSEEKAHEYAQCEDFFVIDAEKQKWIYEGEDHDLKDLDVDGATLYGES